MSRDHCRPWARAGLPALHHAWGHGKCQRRHGLGHCCRSKGDKEKDKHKEKDKDKHKDKDKAHGCAGLGRVRMAGPRVGCATLLRARRMAVG